METKKTDIELLKEKPVETKKTDIELFTEYAELWKGYFKKLIERLIQSNATYNQDLDGTKKETEKLFKQIMNSYHTVEKYHRLTDGINS